MPERKSEKKDNEKAKIKAIAAKHYKNKRRMSLFIEDEKNYDSNSADSHTDEDQANNKNLLLDHNNY